jgi:hypothetical protein
VLQLIIGISLGLILLFVILILISELTATYPVWKHFNRPFHSAWNNGPEKGKQNKLPFLLLLLVCLFGIGMAAFLVTDTLPRNDEPKVKADSASRVMQEPKVRKLLTDSLPGFFFRTETKWEDGKMYCNNQVFLENPQPLHFSDLRYSFLDKDEFLIKELHFTFNDFVSETNGYGGISALLNRCSTELSQKEFDRIDKLQVVLNKMVSGK